MAWPSLTTLCGNKQVAQHAEVAWQLHPGRKVLLGRTKFVGGDFLKPGGPHIALQPIKLMSFMCLTTLSYHKGL